MELWIEGMQMYFHLNSSTTEILNFGIKSSIYTFEIASIDTKKNRT